jgi:hypothetical protein
MAGVLGLSQLVMFCVQDDSRGLTDSSGAGDCALRCTCRFSLVDEIQMPGGAVEEGGKGEP